MLEKMKLLAADFYKKASTVISSNLIKGVSLLLAFTLMAALIICASHTVRVTDGKDTYIITSVIDNAESITQKVAKSPDYEIASFDKNLYSTDVTITYNIVLTVTMGSHTESYEVKSGVLGDILLTLGIMVDDYDIVYPSIDTVVVEDTYVDIVNVEYKTEDFIESIPYGQSVEFSDQYYTTQKKVVAGVDGQKNVTYSVMYVNGVPTSKTALSEEVLSEPTDEKTYIGTVAPTHANTYDGTISTLKVPDDLELDVNGIPVNYKKVKTLHATAYTHTGSRCSTLVWPQPGYVAVDPKKIPYGTRMYIVSADGKYVYGYAIAADTGGFIYDGRTDMDLFLDTETQCVNFGRRNITVYFLD